MPLATDEINHQFSIGDTCYWLWSYWVADSWYTIAWFHFFSLQTLNPSLIIFEPTSINPIKNQSQNILAHIQIPDGGGDKDAQKYDLFDVHMKKIEKLDGTKIVVIIIALKSSSGPNPKVTTLIDDMPIISIPLKLWSKREKVKLKSQGTLPLKLNYSIILILIIENN